MCHVMWEIKINHYCTQATSHICYCFSWHFTNEKSINNYKICFTKPQELCYTDVSIYFLVRRRKRKVTNRKRKNTGWCLLVEAWWCKTKTLLLLLVQTNGARLRHCHTLVHCLICCYYSANIQLSAISDASA